MFKTDDESILTSDKCQLYLTSATMPRNLNDTLANIITVGIINPTFYLISYKIYLLGCNKIYFFIIKFKNEQK